jgi:serine protease Do
VITATVGEMKEATVVPDVPAPMAVAAVDPGWHLTPIDDGARQTFGLPRATTGLVVARVDAGGPAADAGLAAGDVVVQIQQDKVTDAGDVARALTAARREQRHFVIVLVSNAQGLRWMPVSLE